MRRMDYDQRARAAEEIQKLNYNHYIVAAKLGCPPGLVRYWLNLEGLPSAYYLARLHELGCDILYIITGKHYTITGGDTDVRP